MKRIIAYISILAAVLTAGVSCTREAVDGSREGNEITLSFVTEEMSTRVTVNDGTPVAGVGAENTIEYVDYFFFADTDPNSTAIKSGRLTVDELTKVNDTRYTYRFDTSVSGNEPLRGKTYLYVLVNYPGQVNVSTMNELLALPISTDFNEEQTSFVMDSYDNGNVSGLIGLTPTSQNESRTVVVKLARCAAKLVLHVDVKNTFTDESGNLWKPVTSQMWVNFVNARNRTTVDAEAVVFDNKNFYFTTSQKAPAHVTDKSGYTSWEAEAVYTYPQSFTVSDVTAPYFKIFCPWVCDGKGTNNFYYKILLPQIGSFQRNKIYKMTVDLSVIGSTEDDWALATRYIAVADWCYPELIEATFEGAMYLDVPVKYYEIYGVDDIYIPVLSSNDIQITNLRGTKTNLYNGNTTNVSATISDESKEGFKLTHVLNTDMTSDGFDCTPITYTMTVQHTQGGLSKTIDVTVVQYPSIYAKADASNGYAYVNSYAYTRNHGGRYSSGYAYNNRGNNTNSSDQLGSMNQVGSSSSVNNNSNQYVVTVSVLPEGYRVAGMNEDVVIGDPRGGRLAANNLGYSAGTNGNVVRTVQANYNAVSKTTQNVIAPAIRIASSWGATTPIMNYDRAEERCAGYQENGYPAGRWRMPTVAEIDFLIRLSDYHHIPELFSPEYHPASGSWWNQTPAYYDVYWAGGNYAYGGVPYTERNHTNAFIDMSGATTNNGQLVKNNERFVTYMRCVYDEWYWSDTQYNNQGQPGNAATRWIGYIY